MPSPTFGAARWARALLAASIYGHQRPGDPRRPTCDSADILYRRHPYELPLDLAIGDPIDSLSAGAYTGTVAAVAFNGFPRSAAISSDRCQWPKGLAVGYPRH